MPAEAAEGSSLDQPVALEGGNIAVVVQKKYARVFSERVFTLAE